MDSAMKPRRRSPDFNSGNDHDKIDLGAKETLLPPKQQRKGFPLAEKEEDDYDDDDDDDEIKIEIEKGNATTLTHPRHSKSQTCVFSPRAVVALGLLLLFAVMLMWRMFGSTSRHFSRSCDSVFEGHQCQPKIAHFWGQYSPYFRVPSDEIVDAVPDDCQVVFAQALSRHGARYPTPHRSKALREVVAKIKANVDSLPPKWKFFRDYEYTLGADDLTEFGQQQMVNEGIQFYQRYQHLTRHKNPFVRAASQERVVVSAINFTTGFHEAKAQDRHARGPNPRFYDNMVVIEESNTSNNTLSAGLCLSFRHGPSRSIGGEAKSTWANIYAAPIQERLNEELQGADLSLRETINVMELCPYETVNSPTGAISPFCHLFSEDDWQAYSYMQSLEKWYGYANGNPLAPTQGVGFTNELIARMTGEPVHDSTSTNHTLDSDPATFPLGEDAYLFADFSHDNDMMTIFSAMGLFNSTPPLSRVSMQSVEETRGYAAAWAVPFAGRAYFEKMRCGEAEEQEEYVRVLMNDRVVPLQECDVDEYGRCELNKWIESLGFARHGGLWSQCFT